jgi:formate dehydrogenase iron-sulfur subunit
MEPLLEVETESGRIGFSNVSCDDVDDLVHSDFSESGVSGKNIGLVDEVPYLKNQERLCFARNGITDPVSIKDYIEHGGFKGLRRAME